MKSIQIKTITTVALQAKHQPERRPLAAALAALGLGGALLFAGGEQAASARGVGRSRLAGVHWVTRLTTSSRP